MSKLKEFYHQWRRDSLPPSTNQMTWRFDGLNAQIEKADQKLSQIDGEVQNLVKLSQIDAEIQNFVKLFDRRYRCFYNQNPASSLNHLFDQYGSDKGSLQSSGHVYNWKPHSYADFYERQFGFSRHSVKNVFECGLGTNNPALASSMGENGKPGASLRAWRDYFPAASIYGADIDETILFKEERISTFCCDQTSASSIAAMWERIGDVAFDIMIDDGLHSYDSGRILFENSFHKLRDEGVYVIEDVNVQDLLKFYGYFSGKKLNFEFINLFRANTPLADNSLVVIRK